MAISIPAMKMPQWRELNQLFSSLLRDLGLPLLGLAVFLLVWHGAANQIHTSLGKFPGPVEVLEQSKGLYAEYRDDKQREAAFYERQRNRHAERLQADSSYVADEIRPYTGKPTFIRQIGTSLKTVFTGFLLASLIAVPVGIAIGLSSNLYKAINPLIQLFKPISPLAWLPLVTIVVSALYTAQDGLPKSFITSSITVMLCSLWPTLLNTAVGVTSVSADLVNVSRVLRLHWLRHVKSIVIPASVPMIFTGLRLSLSTAWMVLIAAEMLAQNPGLGKFVWDEFQNGSSESLGRIMVAVITIGLIGYLLDRCMLQLQRWVSWDKQSVLR